MRKVIGLSKISSMFQVTVPKEVRQFLDLEDSLLWIKEDNRVYVEKASS